jgi:hypothetical protein
MTSRRDGIRVVATRIGPARALGAGDGPGARALRDA